jgi:hypothetical protein
MATEFFSERVLHFFSSLTLTTPLPRGVLVLNPYQNKVVFDLCKLFYTKYYADNNNRRIIIGINPGRFGGGITGIPFTDPTKLQTVCNIKNDLAKKQELSSDFIYRMIAAYGGPELFYKDFYFTSVSPLGFTKDQKNLNYYDDPKLTERLKPFMLGCLNNQLEFGINTRTAYCLGEGENYKFISRFNDEHHFFKAIIPLPHPRFIMQYKRKSLNEYLDKYLKAFSQSS